MGNQPLKKSIGCQTEPNKFLEKQSIVSKVYRTCYFGDNLLTKTNSIVFNFSKRENYYIILQIKDTIFNYTKFSGSIKLLRNNGVFLQELKFTDEYIIDDNNKIYEIYFGVGLNSLTSFRITVNITVNQHMRYKTVSTFQKDLSNFRNTNTDFELRIKGSEEDSYYSVKCHKLVISRVNFFESYLSNNWNKKDKNYLEVTNITPEVLEIFVYYLYNDEVPDENNLEPHINNLFETGNFYLIDGLIKVCLNHMIKNLNKNNVLDRINMFYKFNYADEVKTCIDLLQKNIEIIRDKKWKDTFTNNPDLCQMIIDKLLIKDDIGDNRKKKRRKL
jgi:hypothetical protein